MADTVRVPAPPNVPKAPTAPPSGGRRPSARGRAAAQDVAADAAALMAAEVSRPMPRDITAATLPTQQLLRSRKLPSARTGRPAAATAAVADEDVDGTRKRSSALPEGMRDALGVAADDEEDDVAVRGTGVLAGPSAQLVGGMKAGRRLSHAAAGGAPALPPLSASFGAALRNGDVAEARRLSNQEPRLITAPLANGDRALHVALGLGPSAALPAVQWLLEAKADVSAENGAALSPLVLAVSNGDVDCAAMLIDHHAAVNISYAVGDSPLHFAAQADQSRTVQLLLDANASPLCRDAAGRLPFELAHDPALRLVLAKAAGVRDEAPYAGPGTSG